ncbi:MAG: TonB-dependent receptor [Saprospiraceae bacterium]|nr:TonB-dependent receptor [Saprospiraceae bacterium]
MLSRKLIFAFTFLLFGQALSAQKAILRGQITDDETAEVISFANIFVQETLTGTNSDLDGYFNINLDPGTYNITISYVGYPDYKITDLVLGADQEEVLNVKLKVQGQELETVVVSAAQLKNSVAALNTLKQKSTKFLDGMAAETIRQAGDGDAGEAIRRVTGVSVEGGKHVFVRGLGDRYTKTTLNGMDIPGLDPDRNSVELDIFPTYLVDNIIVYKTFSPDLAGDFTGGTVDIATKSFPDAKTTSASISVGYNPSMHFKDEFLGYNGGGSDFIAFDDGTRELPIDKTLKVPDPAIQEGSELFDITNSFQKNLAAKQIGNDLNKGFSLSTGNQINKDKVTFGYDFSMNYKNSSQFYEDAQFNTFRLDPDNTIMALDQERDAVGNLGIQDVFWSAMAGGAMKVKEHKFSLHALRLQNGVNQAARIRQADTFENPSVIFKDNLEYAQREITNFLAKGSHLLGEGTHKVEWSFSPTIIQVDEPDIRYSAFEQRDGDLLLAPAVGAEVTRTFRNLQETSFAGKVDYTLKFGVNGSEVSKIKAGFSGLRKMRDFDIQNYLVRVISQGSFDLDGNPDNIFQEENLWNEDSRKGTYIKGNFQPSNTFAAEQQVLSAYAMNEFPITSSLTAIYGVRLEKADNWYTGQNNAGSVTYDDEKVLDDLDILPSVNLVFNLKEKMNFRAAYNRTLARPSFKEKSIAQIQDRITGRVFLGNIDLVASNIDNVDLRWEAFGKRNETISISAFYKRFTNPIELTVFDATAPNNFQPVNVGDARVLGLEIEARKNLGFISGAFEKLTIAGNLTFVDSEVEMKQEEYDARVAAARVGQTIDRNRQMVGQSPFIVNAMLNYSDRDSGWESNVSYNVQGERLAIAGIGLVPDIWEQPFHSLNFKMGKAFGENKPFKISLAVDNILDQNKQKWYNAFEAESQIFEFLNPGTTFSASFSYTIR